MRLNNIMPVIAAGLFPVLPCAAQALPVAQSTYQPRATVRTTPMRVEIIDGTGVRDIETKKIYRLAGVDACASGQTASLNHQTWPCGTVAMAWLVQATLNKWIACMVLREEGDEQIARCATAQYPDLAQAMLRDGLAVLSPAPPQDIPLRAYHAAEQQARKSYTGLWSSTFQMPWEFRAARRGQARSVISEGIRP